MDVSRYYNHPDIVRVCKDLGGQEWEDIRGDCFLKLLSMPESEQLKITNVVAFLVRMCANQSRDFYKKRKPIYIDPINLQDIKESDKSPTQMLEKVEKDFFGSEKRFYHARIFVYANQKGSVKALYRELKERGIGIPYRELTKAYSDYKEYLKNWSKE